MITISIIFMVLAGFNITLGITKWIKTGKEQLSFVLGWAFAVIWFLVATYFK